MDHADHVAIGIPGGGAGNLGIAESAAALDMQDAVAVQLPGSVSAAGAGGDDLRLTLHIPDAVARGKVLGIAVVAHAEDHLAAAPERGCSQIGHAVRQIDGGEVGAVAEGVAVDGLHMPGQGDLRQGGAAAQGGAADGGQLAALGKAYRLQSGAAIEGEVRQVGDTGVHMDRADHVAIGIPGDAGGCLGAGESAAALDIQDAVAIQLPGSACAAAAGGDDRGGTLHIGNAVADGILLGVAVVGHAEDHAAAALERRGGDEADPIRQIHAVKRRAAGKGAAVDGLQALGQHNGRQGAAVIEGRAADQIQLRAFLQIDADQAGASIEGGAGNGGQLAAAFEDEVRHHGAVVEALGGQGGDTGGHIDLADAVLGRLPGNGGAACGGQGTGAGDHHPAVAVQHKARVLTADTGQQDILRGDELSVQEGAALTIHDVFARIGQAVCIEVIVDLVQEQIAGDIPSGGEVHSASGLAVRRPAVVLHLGRVFGVAADGALQLAGGTVIHIGVLIVLADGGGAAGELIQHRPGAVGGHVIGGDGGLEAVGGDVHIDAVEVQGGHVKVEVGIVHDGIGLAAGGAADVVHRAVFVHLTAGHGGGAGIAVVVAGEVEVDPRRIAGSGQILHIGFAAAGGIGVVGGHVGHQHLPGAGGPGRVLHQPLGELLKGILVGGVVQHGNIHVAALHGVPGGGHAEHALGGDGVIAAVIGLVVADHVDHIRVADSVQSEQGQGVLPLVIVADVVHRVAQLDAEGILPGQMIGDAFHALQGGLLLDIGQQEEPGLLFGGGHGEAADLRPDGAVAHLVIVGGPGLKARQRHRVNAVDLLAGGIGDQAAFALHLRSAGHVGAGRDPGHGPGGAVDGIAHPGDGLAVGALGQVIDHIIGSAGFIPHSVIAVQGDLIGAVALRVGGPQVHAALGGRQAGDVDPAVFIGNAQQHIVGVHADAGGGFAVPDHGDGGGGCAAHHGGIRLDAVHGLNGAVRHGSGEAGGILVQVADAQALRLLAAVRPLGDLHVDAAALGDGGGDGDVDRGQRTTGIFLVVNGSDAYGCEAGIVAPCTRYALGEGNIGNGIAARDGDGCRQGGDGRRVAAAQRQLPGLAHSGLALKLQGHAGHVRLLRVHGKVPGLPGDVAVAVLQIEGDGVQAVAEVHQTGGAAQVVPVIRAPVGAVEIEIGGLHAGGVGVGLLTVVIGDEEAEIAGIQDRAVLQLRLGAVIVDQLDGAHHRGGDILVVGAVHHAQVVQQDIALQLALVQLHPVGGIPADAAGGDHGPEQHAAVDPDLCAGIGGQVSLQILPAGLQPLTGAGAAVAEVDIGVGPAVAAISTGGNLGPEPGDGNALGDVDPHAQSGGAAVDGQIVAQAQAGAVGSVDIRPVILQLHGFVAEADDIGIGLVGVGHHGALYHAAASGICIMANGHSVGRYAAECLIHGGADGGVIPGIRVAAVNNHGGLHADVHGDGGRQVAPHGGDGGTAGILHIVGNGEPVAAEASGAGVGDAPLDIVILQMDRLRLIGGLEAQIADVLIVQVHLVRGKGQPVGVLHMQHGGAHRLTAADQVHRHIPGLAGGGEHGAGAAAGQVGGGHRAHGRVADGENRVLRQGLGGSAGEVHGLRRQGDGGAGGIVLVVGGDGGVVKLAGGRHGGHHQDGAGHHALAAAGRGVAHGHILLTLPLGDVGGGAALVQLDGRHAAQGHHHPGLLGRGIAHGTGGHGAVGLEQHHGAVGLDAHAGAGIVAAVAGLGDDHLTVPDHGHQGVHGLQDLHGLALLGALIRLGLGQGGALPEHVHGAVVKGGDERAAGVVVMHHAVHHQIARGLAGVDVEPGGVDAAHHVQTGLFFIDMGLVRGGFQGPALLLGVAVAVTGHDFGPAAGGVDLHDVCNRLGIARVIVGDDDTLGNVGCDGVVLH